MADYSEAVQAALAELDKPENGWLVGRGRVTERDVRIVVAAAAPLIARDTAEKIAAAIRAESRRPEAFTEQHKWAFEVAARAARSAVTEGEQR